MHIPDGFLDTKTAIATGALASLGLGFACWHARRTLPRRRVPLLGLAAAFVFAAQMLNFPVAGGTSGHLIGGVLTAALLGPSAAVIVITAVLILQCFAYADGGVTALGANVFNMALIGGVGGWALYHLLTRLFKGLFGRILAASFAAWVSTVLAAIACAGELAASHKAAWSLAFPTMAGIHMLIGIGEGVITALVLAAIARARPELVLDDPAAPAPKPYFALTIYGLLLALGLVLFVAPNASKFPDGLEKASAMLGIASQPAALTPPMPEYAIPFVNNPALSIGLAGAIGTVVVFAISWLLARTLVSRKNTP